MHEGDAVREFLRRHQRLQTAWLPPYAPELNPVECLWTHLKTDRMANFTPQDVPELLARVSREVARAQRDPARLRSFFLSSLLIRRATA